MNQEPLCSEQEAARIAGVSLRTLLRFSEAGYLTLYSQSDGSHKYQRAQIQEIFGLSASTSQRAPEAASHPGMVTAESVEIFEQGKEECNISSDVDSSCAVEASAFEQESIISSSNSGRTISTNTASANTASANDPQIATLVDEINRLRNLMALQERILDSKDDEIADLRNQRAWLRERIEKLEEKSDRDQILLLSETQTIRSLIAYQESRKSTFRQLLEWTGLVRDSSSAPLPQLKSGDYNSKHSSTPGSSRTIDLSKAANAG